MIPISVLDIQSPVHMPTLVTAIEEAGYHRYWASEHHSPGQSASPAMMAGFAAGLTSTLRVGSAGVLLRLASPVRVAQDFALLELFYPGRVDLGLAGSSSFRFDAEYQLDVNLSGRKGYEEKLTRLAQLVRGER